MSKHVKAELRYGPQDGLLVNVISSIHTVRIQYGDRPSIELFSPDTVAAPLNYRIARYRLDPETLNHPVRVYVYQGDEQ